MGKKKQTPEKKKAATVKKPFDVDVDGGIKLIPLGKGSFALCVEGSGIITINSQQAAALLAEKLTAPVADFFGKEVLGVAEDVLELFGIEADLNDDGE